MIDLPGDIFQNYGDHFYDEKSLSNHGYALAKWILLVYYNGLNMYNALPICIVYEVYWWFESVHETDNKWD